MAWPIPLFTNRLLLFVAPSLLALTAEDGRRVLEMEVDSAPLDTVRGLVRSLRR